MPTAETSALSLKRLTQLEQRGCRAQHRLRENDARRPDPRRKPQRHTCVQLLAANGFERCPERLAADRAHVERKGNDARRHVGEFNAEDQRQAEEDPEQLHEHGCAAEEFYVDAGNAPQHGSFRCAGKRQQEAENAAEHDADQGELECGPEAEKESLLELEHDREVEAHHRWSPQLAMASRRRSR